MRLFPQASVVRVNEISFLSLSLLLHSNNLSLNFTINFKPNAPTFLSLSHQQNCFAWLFSAIKHVRCLLPLSTSFVC